MPPGWMTLEPKLAHLVATANWLWWAVDSRYGTSITLLPRTHRQYNDAYLPDVHTSQMITVMSVAAWPVPVDR